MRPCPACSEENKDTAKYCSECATPLTVPEPVRETRKLVTVLFADMSGSTQLGERLDPEALRAVMERLFDAMRDEIQRHGGTVEKFIGDAVMAVFGIPRAHEDDALRAVRAALGLQASLRAANSDLEEKYGTGIRVRVGVNSGEVVTGDPGERQRLVTGDTVNVAARFEQAAAPGEVLIGRETFRLVRDAVDAEEVLPLDLKGKAEPVRAYRVLRLIDGADAIARRKDTAFVGRARERGLLVDALERVRADRSCHLFTLLGIPGVGKSRLVAEVMGHEAADITVVSGRCLPYGDGITFWPVLEIVKQGAGITEADPVDVVHEKIALVLGEEDDADVARATLEGLLGLDADARSLEETIFGIRRYLEALARRHPMVVVIDDLHWAMPPLLDLIEHVLDWSRDVPLLLLCLARPELLETRPGWGGGKMNATTILLEPLDEHDASTLVEQLLAATDLPDALTTRVVRAAEGNPLFVEELLAMLVDEGALVREDGRWRQADPSAELALPSSIQALLAARLDQLEPAELRVVEGGAVVGQVFYRSALSELAPEALAPDVGTYLRNLVRKDLLRPERSAFPGEETYRFRHILLRDAAYRAMPKRTRAELHERFADWLERTVAERLAEFEEIVGYHLEQAYRYRIELEPGSAEGTRALRDRAARSLSAAGRRAHARGDMKATLSLLGRATRLLPVDDPRRLAILHDLADALAESAEDDEARRLLDEGIQAAPNDGMRTHLILARRELITGDLSGDVWENAAEQEATEALRIFEQEGDESGLAIAWRTLGFAAWGRGDVARAITCWEHASKHAEAVGDRGRHAHDLAWVVIAHGFGTTPAESVLSLGLETMSVVAEFPAARAEVLWEIATAYAMLGGFEHAEAAVDESRRIEQNLGRNATANHFLTQVEDDVARFKGDDERRIAALRVGLDAWRELYGEVNPMLAARLAQALADVGDDDAAWQASQEARAVAGDFLHVALYCLVAEALVLARRGDVREALERATEALNRVRGTGFFWNTGDVLAVLGDVNRIAGREVDAVRLYRDALRIYEAKGIVPLVESLRKHLSEPQNNIYG